jgi:hypothetical protein
LGAKAKQCEELARQVRDEEARVDLILIARQWQKLAEQARTLVLKHRALAHSANLDRSGRGGHAADATHDSDSFQDTAFGYAFVNRFSQPHLCGDGIITVYFGVCSVCSGDTGHHSYSFS